MALLLDEPILAVHKAKSDREVQGESGRRESSSLFSFWLGAAFASIGANAVALVFVALGLRMHYLFRMSQRIRDANARLSFNSGQFIAEKPGQNTIHGLNQSLVINQIKGQDSESNYCIYKIEFKDGAAYWVYGEDDANAFVTELHQVAAVRII